MKLRWVGVENAVCPECGGSVVLLSAHFGPIYTCEGCHAGFQATGPYVTVGECAVEREVVRIARRK